MGARAFVWLGGTLFVIALGACAWSFTVVMAGPMEWTGWTAVTADVLLLTLFALHHSLFARDRAKAWLQRAVPAPLMRSAYVWIASVLLLTVSLGWQPIGGQVYTATGIPEMALAAVQIAGLLITARAVARIDPLELAGIRPSSGSEGLQVTGPYGWVRHPLYFGWLLMVFGAAPMTGDRLTFATVTTAYLVVAIPWEERSLRRSFGDAYARYARDVRWRMLPFIY